MTTTYRAWAYEGPPAPPDTTPPTVPQDLAGAFDGLNVQLTWSASTGSPARYVVYRDDILVALRATTDFTDTVTPGTYPYTVTARDAAGNESAASDPVDVVVPVPADVEAPSAPTDAAATNVGNTVTVTWTASSDNLAVAGYGIYRNGALVALDTASPYVDTVPGSGDYDYTLRAYDAAANVSGYSVPGSVTIVTETPPDTTAPTVPADVEATYDGTNVTVTWTASTDAGGIHAYVIYRDSVPISFDLASPYVDIAIPGAHTYQVAALDEALNLSALSAGADVTVASGLTPDVDTSGDTDVSTAMAAFLASVPDGSTIELVTGAIYQMEFDWRFIDRHDLTINGNGATIRCSDPEGGAITPGTYGHRLRSNIDVIGGSSGITFNNLRIVGANPYTGMVELQYDARYEAQHGINIVSASDINVIGCSISGVYGDFVYLGKVANLTGPTNVTVRNLIGINNGRMGIAIADGHYVTIEGCQLDQMRRAAFDLEPNSPSSNSVDHVTIQDNVIGAHRLNFLSAAGQGHVDYVDILRNQLVGSAMSIDIRDGAARGSGPLYRTNINIVDNVSDAATGNGLKALIMLATCDQVTITGNVQPFQAGRIMYLVVACDWGPQPPPPATPNWEGGRPCTNLTVEDNTIVGVRAGQPDWPGGSGQLAFGTRINTSSFTFTSYAD